MFSKLLTSISTSVANSSGALIDKGDTMNLGDGAIFSLVAIVMVFAILLIFIGITELVFKAISLFDKKKTNKVVENAPQVTSNEPKEVVITDDDMMAAVLVATIDYRNEVKKDVRVVNVKQL